MTRYVYTPNHPPGLPGIYEEVVSLPSYDGDTISVMLQLLGECRIRLSGVDTPELRLGGDRARDYVNVRLREAESLWCWLELATDKDGDGRISLRELLDAASWDRWPGTVFVDGVDIRQDLLTRGLATEC